MDLEFTDEQRLLGESAERFFGDNYDLPKRRERTATKRGFDEALWQEMGELGWLALRLPERLDGFGAGMVECVVVMEAAGKSLAAEPLLNNAVIAATALDASGSDDTEFAQGIASGECTVALAYAEPRSRYSLQRVATSAVADDGTYTLSGTKSVVSFGGSANKLIVSARTSGKLADAAGITLFWVDADATGISIRDYPTVDGLRAADISFDNVKVDATNVLGAADDGLRVLNQIVDEAIIAVCAEAVGALQHLHEATLEYVKTRKQFGLPIAKFQVIQHRLVDMYVALELARSMTLLAAAGMGSANAQERARLASTAKVKVGEAIRLVGQDAVQLHGGMGMTDELDVSHYFKRVTMIDASFGDVDHHLRRLTTL
ncbi:MAG: pimeloyl-CoA dehydrogenase small subunit [Chromatiales bacterium]|nr:pimeloyl-CoA dehydrogenase small subunit [Chromatiales bacterium]